MQQALARTEGTVREELRFIRGALLSTIAVLWLVELIDVVLFHTALDQFGIVPRAITGLYGILSAPFLHASWGHLLSNTIGLAIFGTLVLMWGRREFLAVSVASIFVGGIGVWIVGASGTHLGASGVVFGYFGYLLARGFYERRLGSIVLSVVIAVVFGSMLSGVVPGLAGPGISWEAHLFGMLGGILVARRFHKRSAVVES